MLLKILPLGIQERSITKATILFWHRKKWFVHALSVMPTHSHILATPMEATPGEWYSLSEILHSVKRGSSLRINRYRASKGSVWWPESYNHIIRNEREWSDTFAYILNNAVADGLAEDPYAYDGFWCESMEGLQPELSLPRLNDYLKEEIPSKRRVAPRVPQGTFIQRQRNLPHWELPGSSYHIQFSIKGHRVPNIEIGLDE
jgi:putative transposase